VKVVKRWHEKFVRGSNQFSGLTKFSGDAPQLELARDDSTAVALGAGKPLRETDSPKQLILQTSFGTATSRAERERSQIVSLLGFNVIAAPGMRYGSSFQNFASRAVA